MKIQTKTARLQMHEILHKKKMKTCFHSQLYANFQEFLRRAINTSAAKSDCSRIYRSLPNATTVKI